MKSNCAHITFVFFFLFKNILVPHFNLFSASLIIFYLLFAILSLLKSADFIIGLSFFIILYAFSGSRYYADFTWKCHSPGNITNRDGITKEILCLFVTYFNSYLMTVTHWLIFDGKNYFKKARRKTNLRTNVVI